MASKIKVITTIVLSTILVISTGIMCYADNYTDNSAIYVYDEDTNPNGNMGLISYYNEASADTDTMKEYIDAGDTYFANQLSLCRTDVVKGKNLLRSALAYKGVSLPENPTYVQIAQGIANIPAQNSSGAMTITAHFHLDGNGVNKTFTGTPDEAWAAYQSYLNSHNTGTRYSSNAGCYKTYYHHAHGSSCYSWSHQHNDYCYRTDNYWDYGYTRTEIRPGDWCDVCNYCGQHWGVGTFQCVHPRTWLVCTQPVYQYLSCGYDAGTYYLVAGCSYSNGQILKIDVTY